MPSEMVRCDSLGFPDGPFKPITFDESFLQHLKKTQDKFVMHITVCPPLVTETDLILRGLNSVTDVCAMQGVEVLRSRRDLETLLPGHLGVLLGIQCPPSDASISNLERLHDAGLRVMPLAYKLDTPYGGGYAGTSGLTPTGTMMIDACINGFIIDIAHTNDETALGCLRLVENLCGEGRVMNSHTGCKSVYEHRRNHSDEVIRMLGGLNGYLGIYSVTFMTSDNDDTLRPFVNHARRACNLIGSDKVGIGSDGHYRVIPQLDRKTTFELMCSRINDDGNVDGVRFPDTPDEANTHLRHEVMVEALEQSNFFQPEEIDNMGGGSFYSFLSRALPD